MPEQQFPTCEIMGVRVAVTDMDATLRLLRDNLERWRGEYICVANVHTTVTAHRDEEYRRVQNGSAMVLPDGGPLSKYSRTHGYPQAKRVTGPDLMRRVLAERDVYKRQVGRSGCSCSSSGRSHLTCCGC